MAKLELGPVGAVVTPGEKGFVETAARLEGLGFTALWVTGGPLRRLDQLAEVIQATQRVPVISSILSVDRFSADDVGALYADLEAAHPGRFVVGLGGAHGPHPLALMATYLEQLKASGVPPSRIVLAALGPKMAELARRLAGGAVPVLVTPEYTSKLREQLGDDVTLAAQQLVVVEIDPELARVPAREMLGLMKQGPAYRSSWRRMGFNEDDIEQLSDRLIDGLVAWGNADDIAIRVRGLLDAGADHVPVLPLAGDLDAWNALSDRLTRDHIGED